MTKYANKFFLFLLLVLALNAAGEKTVLFVEDSETGMLTNWQPKKVLEQDLFDSKNASVVSNWFQLKKSLKEDAFLIYRIETPSPIKRLGITTNVQSGNAEVFLSTDGKDWSKICEISKESRRFTQSLEKPANSILVKFSGTIQLQGPLFWIDCKGQSEGIKINEQDYGPGRIQLISHSQYPFVKGEKVYLKTEKNFQSIRSKILPYSCLKDAGSSVFDDKQIDLVFFLKNEGKDRESGFLEIYLPEKVRQAEVLCYYYGKRIDQPADRIIINGNDITPPSIGGDHWADPLYPQANQNDVMEFVWNKLRPQSDKFIYSHQFLRKERFLYEYLTKQGEWKEFKPTPWYAVPVPEDASISPLHIRAKLLDEKGNFSAQAYTFKDKLNQDEFWLPVENFDGRGNGLIGWRVLGIHPAGKFPASDIKGTKNRLVIFYTLAGDGNMLDDSPNNPDYGEINDRSADPGAYTSSSFSMVKLRVIGR